MPPTLTHTGASTLYYLLSDHLGSTAITVDTYGNKVAELRYKPWGETRYTSGTTPTDLRYTGQREEGPLGLYYYKARFYDPMLGRFAQADTIVPNPGDARAWDRYAYALNAPTRYVDPTGHWYYDPGCDCMVDNGEPEFQYEGNLTHYRDRWGLYGARREMEETNNYQTEPAIALGGNTTLTTPPLVPLEVTSYQPMTIGADNTTHTVGYYYYTDWDEVDKLAVGLDALGIAGDLGFAACVFGFVPGCGVFAVAEFLEAPALVNDIAQTNMNPKELAVVLSSESLMKLIPGVGLIFNFFSIVEEIEDATQIWPIREY